MATAAAAPWAPEPLLDENPDRYCMFPLKEDRVWSQYKKAETTFWTTFWTAEDVDFSSDARDWQDRLAPGERSFLSSVLAYLAASDRLIQHNVVARFMIDVELAEARAFYAFQLFKKNVHTEMVSAILAALFAGKEEQLAAVLRTVLALPAFQAKAAWVRKWINSGASFPERLVAFAAVSSVFNAGSFAGLYCFKKRGLLPGTGHATDLISRDEGVHVESAGVMYSLLRSKLTDSQAQGIVGEAVEAERAFVCGQLPLEATGLEAGAMEEYLQYVGDRLLGALGHAPLYRVAANPLPWLEGIAMKAPEVKAAAAAGNIGGMSRAGALAMAAGDRSGGLAFDEDF